MAVDIFSWPTFPNKYNNVRKNNNKPFIWERVIPPIDGEIGDGLLLFYPHYSKFQFQHQFIVRHYQTGQWNITLAIPQHHTGNDPALGIHAYSQYCGGHGGHPGLVQTGLTIRILILKKVKDHL